MLAGAYSSIRTVYELAYCYNNDHECLTYQDAIKKGFGIAGVLLCILFVFFTACMFFDQIKMKFEETSTIDRKQ